MENAILDVLRTRRSIRKFQPGQITDEELEAVLESGTFAPTGKDLQDPWIVAVQNPEIIKTLSKMNSRFLGIPSIDPYYGAPTIVLVFAPKPENCPNSLYDGALVLGNMMNAAHAIGLGSCWINREREMFVTPDGVALMQSFGLPDDLIGIGALSLGYPASESKGPGPRKKDYCRIIR